MSKPDLLTVIAGCDRFLTFHPRLSPRQELMELAEYTPAGAQADVYGEGVLIREFEQQIAGLLGKEAAVFMPSGTMAQQIALRMWSERRGTPNVAFHPRCHMELREQKGLEYLHGLHGVLLGEPERLLTVEDLKRVAVPLAALLVELPQRELGGILPAWEDLLALTGEARRRGIPLHMDGARLWESGPFYARSYAEIAGLFDTVYVSFYKGLGGITGAALAGPEEMMREARVWLRRHGGNLKSMYPFVLSARKGLEERLPRMAAYHARAVELAEVLAQFPGVEIVPNPPHTNMLHVYLRGTREALEQAALEIALERRVFLFYQTTPTVLPNFQRVELSMGDCSLEFAREELAELFSLLLAKAAAFQPAQG